MLKYGQFFEDESPFRIIRIGRPDHGLEQYLTEYEEPVLNYLKALPADQNLVYALVNALGAGEYYSSNRNGDYFPEEALKQYHPTFVSNGKVYKHHINKDPKKKLGDILFSHYNDKMHRVELVITLDRRIPDAMPVIQRIEAGESPKSSMGCRVPYDICSITGKQQRTRADYSEYCAHRLNQVLENGKKICAINTKPTFFDISIVTIPADRTSHLIHAYAGKQSPVQNEGEKVGVMEKEISSNMTTPDPYNQIYDSQKALSEGELDALKSVPLEQALSTLLALRIIPKRDEFSRIVTASLGNEQIVDFQPVQAEPPSDISPENVNPDLAEKFAESWHELALLKPLLLSRVLEKRAAVIIQPPATQSAQLYPNSLHPRERAWWQTAILPQSEEPVLSPVKDPTGAMLALGALYGGYLSIFGKTGGPGFVPFIAKNPWLAPLIAGSVGYASAQLQKSQLEKIIPHAPQPVASAPILEKDASAGRLGMSFLTAAPLSYYAAGKNEALAQSGHRITSTENLVRKYPLAVSLAGTAAGYYLSGKLLSKFGPKLVKSANKLDNVKTASYINTRAVDAVNFIYNDFILMEDQSK
jgi:hypothetical protein